MWNWYSQDSRRLFQLERDDSREQRADCMQILTKSMVATSDANERDAVSEVLFGILAIKLDSLSIVSRKTLLNPPSASLHMDTHRLAPETATAISLRADMSNRRYLSRRRSSSFQSHRPEVKRKKSSSPLVLLMETCEYWRSREMCRGR